jgi:hypothetical protein
MRRLAGPIGIASLLLIALALAGGSLALADGDLNARLHGEYAFTQIHFCVQTNVSGQNFGDPLFGQVPPIPPFQVPAGGATTRTLSNEGVLTFNGDGTGTFAGKSLSMNHNVTGPGAIPVSEADFTCSLTYTVNLDGSFTTQVECSGTILSGGGAGLTFTTSGTELNGQLGQGRKIFIANDTNPNVETFTLTPPAGDLVFKRICGRSQTAIRMR